MKKKSCGNCKHFDGKMFEPICPDCKRLFPENEIDYWIERVEGELKTSKRLLGLSSESGAKRREI